MTDETEETEESEIVIPYCPRPEQAEIHAALDDHRFSVLVAHRRMGKTVAAVNHLIKRAIECPMPRGQYAYVGPLRNQAKDIAWIYLKRYTACLPGREVNETELSVTFSGGSRIRIYGADNPDSLRGIYLDGVIMDEVAQMKPEVWHEVVRPALSDRLGWAVFIGTPKGANLFHELYQTALTTEGWYGGMWRADQTGAIPETELAALRDEMSAAQYRQEFLCDFSASSDEVLIPIDLADAASRVRLTEWDVKGADRVIGIDIARYGPDRSAICLREGVWCREIRTYQGLETVELSDKIALAVDEFRPSMVFGDSGYNPGVLDLLRKRRYAVVDVNFGGRPEDESRYWNKRAEMWCRMRDWLKRGGAIPDDPALKTDLSTPHYGFADDGTRIKIESKELIKKRGGRSPDLGDALALTFAYDPGPALVQHYDAVVDNLYASRYEEVI